MVHQRSLRVPEPQEIVRWLGLLVKRWPLWVVLALGAFLRSAALDLIPFGAVEVAHLQRALAPAAHPTETTLLHYFLWLLGGREPLAAAAALVALNVLALGGFYLVIERFYGARTAALAVGFLAVNPWAVLASRGIAPAALALPLSLLLMGGLYLAVLGRWPWGWAAAGWAAGALVLEAPQALWLVLALGLFGVCLGRRVDGRHALLGLLVAGFLWLPRLAAYGGEAWRRLWQEAATGTLPLAVEPLLAAYWASGGAGLTALLAPSGEALAIARGLLGRALQGMGVLSLLALLGMLALAIRAWGRWQERRDPAGYAFLAFWGGIPLLALTLRGARTAPLELAWLLPASALSLALLLDALLAWLRAPGAPSQGRGAAAVGAWGLVLLFMFAGACSTGAVYEHLVRQDASQGYGTPLRFWLRTARAVTRALASAPRKEVWVALHEEHEAPAVLRYLLEPEVRLVFMPRAGQALLLPAERSAFYLFTHEEDPRRGALKEAEPVALVLFPQKGRVAELWWAPGRPVGEWLGEIPEREWVAYDAGLRLIGYEAPRLASRTLVITTYWTFEGVPPQERAFRHRLVWLVYGPEGGLAAQAFDFGIPEAAWREGLLLRQEHVIPLEEEALPEVLTLHLLVTRWPDGHRHLILDELRRPIGERVIIGPFVTPQ